MLSNHSNQWLSTRGWSADMFRRLVIVIRFPKQCSVDDESIYAVSSSLFDVDLMVCADSPWCAIIAIIQIHIDILTRWFKSRFGLITIGHSLAERYPTSVVVLFQINYHQEIKKHQMFVFSIFSIAHQGVLCVSC